MQIGYAQPLPIRCTCTGILQHALARPLDHTCSGIGLFHFIPVHPLWMAKFHKVVLSRVPRPDLLDVLLLELAYHKIDPGGR